MKFFRNIKLTQKISLLSISFFIFLVVIGFASIKQISSVNQKLMDMAEIERTTEKLLDMAKRLSEITSGFTV